MNKVKVYVEVFARFTSDGKLLPVALIWEDGSKYLIDRIVKYERCASRRSGRVRISFPLRPAGLWQHRCCPPKSDQQLSLVILK